MAGGILTGEKCWKILQNQMLSCAKAGFHGLSSSIAPSLLPLLHKVTLNHPEEGTGILQFWSQLLDALATG